MEQTDEQKPEQPEKLSREAFAWPFHDLTGMWYLENCYGDMLREGVRESDRHYPCPPNYAFKFKTPQQAQAKADKLYADYLKTGNLHTYMEKTEAGNGEG